MTVQKILVTGDIFRPTRSLDSSQKYNIRWLTGLLEAQVGMASGLEVSSLLVEDVAPSLSAVYRASGLQPSLDAWAGIYEELPAGIADLFRPHLEGAMIIGFELPPGLRRLLVEIGTPYIDMVLHPVRYMRDLLLGFESNVAAIQVTLESFSMSEAQASLETAPLRAFAGRSRPPDLDPGSLLFIGQMAEDRSMISQGRFLRPEDYMARLIPKVEALSDSRSITVKLHPLERNQAILEELRGAGFEIRETTVQTYTLLASSRIASVISVSSSVGEEARFFGKPAVYGLGPSTPVRYRENLVDGIGHVSICDHFMATDFWRACLAPVMPVSDPDGLPPVAGPNLLRTTMRSYWGYEDFAFEGGQRLGPHWAGTHRARGSLAAVGLLEASVAWGGWALKQQLRRSKALRRTWQRLKGRR